MSQYVPLVNAAGSFADIEGAESWPLEQPLDDDLWGSEWSKKFVLFRAVYRTMSGRWLLCESSYLYATPPDRCWFGGITPVCAATHLLNSGHDLPEDLARLVAEAASGGPTEATATRERRALPSDGQPAGRPGPQQFVTLDQAAALVNRTKRALEHYKRTMPKPRVLGGGGKPHLYSWSEMRPWLAKTFGTPDLPEDFPADRNAGRS